MAMSVFVPTLIASVIQSSALATDARAGSRQQLLDVSSAKVAVAPVLVDFMKELQVDLDAGRKRSAMVSRWCKESQAQRASMASVLQRQLDEARIAEQQVGLQRQRLASEARLANTTSLEKQMQLQEATNTLKLASEEFRSQRDHMERMLGESGRAVKLVDQQGAQMKKRQKPQQPPQAQDDGADDAAIAADVARTLDPEAGMDSPSEQVALSLRWLDQKLKQEHSEAAMEQRSMLEKLMNFTDRLNSSLMEAQSQVAAIHVEAAQRKREHARIKGRTASLESLLGAAQRSESAAATVCSDETHLGSEVARIVREESHAVSELLSTLPSSHGASTKDAPAASFLQVGSKVAATSMARKALEGLRSLAQRFPDEADIYSDGMRILDSAASALPLASKLEVDAVRAKPSDSDDPAYDPLRNVRQFVDEGSESQGQSVGKSDGEDVASAGDAPDASKVRALYAKLLKGIRGKEVMMSADDQRCHSLLRDAVADRSAMGRSHDRVAAKLRIAQASAVELEQGVAYNAAQRKLVEAGVAQLKTVSKKVEGQLAHSTSRLAGYAQQLLKVATMMDQAQENDSKSVRDLIQRVEEHRSMLQQHLHRFQEHRRVAEEADSSLLRSLDEDTKYGSRQLSRLRAEADLLASRSDSKQTNLDLANQFEGLINTLCSADHLKKLQHREQELLVEEQFLRKAFPSAAVGGS